MKFQLYFWYYYNFPYMPIYLHLMKSYQTHFN